jgi:PAS domain-containing protein
MPGLESEVFPVLSLLLFVAADPAPTVKFIRNNCVACHNKSNAAGDVDFFTLNKTPNTFDAERDRWERAASKIKHNEMPPPSVTTRPPAAEAAAVVRFLEDEFARQDRTAPKDPGRVTARRLNRTEYNNTVRDLLGVDIRPADSFPNDETAYGFDNIGDALTLSSVLLERYLYAAERVVRTAIFGPERLKPAMIHYPTPVRINDTVDKPTLPKDFFHYDETGLSTRHSAHISHRFPVDGEYNIRLILNGHRPNQSEAVKPALYIDGKLAHQWEFDATDLEGQSVEIRTQVKAGDHLLSATYLRNYHGLPEKYKGPEPSKRPPMPMLDSVRGALTEKDIETLRKYGTKIKTDRIETRIDNRFEAIDVGGPFTQTMGPSAESTRRVFVCAQQTEACARTIVADFTRRAFRRTVTAKEVEPYMKLYRLAREQGDSFQEGVATALQGVLVSPHFLFRIERDPVKEYAPVSDFELASRLSYFLWSSMPDAQLLNAADRRSLRTPAALRAQVRRMLRDPKSRALVDNFAGQWLQFKNIDVLKPDTTRFPNFEDSLRESMRRETELFLEDLIRNDASVLEILDSNHTFLNERLARFYGIPGIVGPEFRRVDMSRTQRGGGVLAQASILTISSYSTRTSPVLRGKWILENLLNAPPPPPPPVVPALDENKIGQSMTLRQQMEAHRANPACASCHSRMDPLGFGLENLNAIGEWRDKDGSLPIDASGMLPGGRKFTGPVELKALLKESREDFVKGLTEKLLTYALGRGLERYDRPVISEIAAKLPANQYRFSSLVLEIVNSLPFQQRRAVPAAR